MGGMVSDGWFDYVLNPAFSVERVNQHMFLVVVEDARSIHADSDSCASLEELGVLIRIGKFGNREGADVPVVLAAHQGEMHEKVVTSKTFPPEHREIVLTATR